MPALVDMVVGIVIFVNTVRATLLGADYTRAALLVGAFGIMHMACSLLVAKLVSPKNVIIMLVLSMLAFIGACFGMMLTDSISTLIIFTGFCGIGTGLFFPTIQVFMKLVATDEKNTLARAIGNFLFAWSAGMAIGPFIAGYLLEIGKTANNTGSDIVAGSLITHGWTYAYILSLAGLFAVLYIIYWIKTHTKSKMSSHIDAMLSEKPVYQDNGLPDLAWLGWLAIFMGMLSMMMMRSVFPAGATRLGIAESAQGKALFLLCLAQAAAGILLPYLDKWVYNGKIVLGLGVIGSAGLLSLALPQLFVMGNDVLWLYYLGSLLLGVYSGSIFFYSSYHSLCHAVHAGRNIGISETFAGLGNIMGPLLGGSIADRLGFSAAFIASAILVSMLAVLQFIVHLRNKVELVTPDIDKIG